MSVYGPFEATQMVPSTRTTLQVKSARLGIFQEKIWRGPKNSKNLPVAAKIEGYNTRFSDFLEVRAPNAMKCLVGPWELIGKESCGLERIYGWFYVQFKAILGFTRNEQMGCLEVFRGNANGLKHPHNVTSHIELSRNVSGEKRPGSEKSKNVPKTANI